MLNFNKIFERIKVLTDINNQKVMAQVFDIEPVEISAWEKQDIFPWDRMLQLASLYGFDPIFFIQEKEALKLVQPANVRYTFSDRLKRAREDQDFNQTELARQAGTTQQTIQQWENKPPKNPDAFLIKRVAKLVKISPLFLRTGKEFQKPEADKNYKILMGKEAGQLGDEITLVRMEAAEKTQNLQSDFNAQKKQLELITQEKVDMLMEQVRFMMLSEENIKETLLSQKIPSLFKPDNPTKTK